MMGRKPPRYFQKAGNGGVKFVPLRLIVLTFVGPELALPNTDYRD
jgi:hypothetical protein